MNSVKCRAGMAGSERSAWFFAGWLAAAVLVLAGSTASAADPGTPAPGFAEASSQKPGSVLLFPYYTSNSADTSASDSRVSLTNVSQVWPITLHVFVVSGVAGTVSDFHVLLAPAQTATFAASDFDPDNAGFLVAVAVDGATGWPISRNFLTGDIRVRADRFEGLFPAEAFAAAYSGQMAGYTGSEATAALRFDGVAYNRPAATLAVDSLGSVLDGHEARLALARVGGSLVDSVAPMGWLNGILYDEDGGPASFSVSAAGPGLVQSIGTAFPPVARGFGSIVRSGRTGWMKISTLETGIGIAGVLMTIRRGASAGEVLSASGRTLRRLALAKTSVTWTIPVFPPA